MSNIESENSQNVGLEDYNNISDIIFPYSGCPIDIVPRGIRIFSIKEPSMDMNSIHLARRPMLLLGLGTKKFRKN